MKSIKTKEKGFDPHKTCTKVLLHLCPNTSKIGSDAKKPAAVPQIGYVLQNPTTEIILFHLWIIESSEIFTG